MKTTKLLLIAFIALFLGACSDDDDNNNVPNVPSTPSINYSTFTVINEGNFGQDPASISHITGEAESFTDNIFKTANPSHNLGTTGTCGVKENNTLYVLSKGAGLGSQLVKMDATTNQLIDSLKTTTLDLGSAYYFVTASNSKGYLASTTGLFEINLADLTVAKKVELIDTSCANLIVKNDLLYVLTLTNVQVLDLSDLSLTASIPLTGNIGGMVLANNIFVATDDKLIEINVTNHATTTHNLTSYTPLQSYKPGSVWDGVVYPPFFESKGSLSFRASTNSIVFASTTGKVCEYSIADKTVSELYTLPETTPKFDGQGVAVDPTTGNIIVLAVFIDASWQETNAAIELENGSNEVLREIAFSKNLYPNAVVF